MATDIQTPTFEENVANALDNYEGEETLEEAFNELIKDHNKANELLRELSGGYAELKEALEQIAHDDDGLIGSFAEHVLGQLEVSDEAEAIAEVL